MRLFARQVKERLCRETRGSAHSFRLIYEPCLARTRVYRDNSLVSRTGACMHSLKLNVGQTPKFTNPAHILEVCVSCATEDSYDQVVSSLNTGFLDHTLSFFCTQATLYIAKTEQLQPYIYVYTVAVKDFTTG